ncbi:hypothetical protein FO519_010116, partial [Halicephalobus sp. NKZ332]
MSSLIPKPRKKSSEESSLIPNSRRKSSEESSLIPNSRRKSSSEVEGQVSTEKTTISDEGIPRKLTSSTLSSAQSKSRIPVFSNKRKIAVEQNYIEEDIPTIPIRVDKVQKHEEVVAQYTVQPEVILTRDSIEIPKLDFSSFRDNDEKEKAAINDNLQRKDSNVVVSDVIQAEKTTEVGVQAQNKEEDIVQLEAESGGRTSRDISSIDEIEPSPKVIEIDEEKKTNSASTLKDDSPLREEEAKVEVSVIPKDGNEEKESPKSDESIFSALPSSDALTSNQDLQSLPDLEDGQEDRVSSTTEVEQTNVPHADSDPERLPSGSTILPSAISSSKLLDLSDSPVPSPPHVKNVPINMSESLNKKDEEKVDEKEVELLEDIKTPSEIADMAVDALQSASESTNISSASNVVVPKSLEREEEPSAETPLESAKTSGKSESSTTSSAATVSEKSTTE